MSTDPTNLTYLLITARIFDAVASPEARAARDAALAAAVEAASAVPAPVATPVRRVPKGPHAGSVAARARAALTDTWETPSALARRIGARPQNVTNALRFAARCGEIERRATDKAANNGSPICEYRRLPVGG